MTPWSAPTATPIELSPELSLPIDAVTQTFAILGKRGRGKTNTAVVLAEELIKTGLPVWMVDTVGAWWGLRSSADGKGAGLPVVVFGGDHADVPLEDTAGKLIARVLIEKQIPAVIDTSGFSKAGARKFLTAFVTEVYHRNRTPVHVIFDEADELAPQRPGMDGIALLGAMEDFVRRGRLRGLGCTLVTQRPAVLHKDVLTQAEILVSMGMTGPRDVAAINEWVALHADDGEAKTVRDSLASLPVGTAWVWSPEWLGILQKVKIRPRRTFDSSATPKVGQRVLVPQKRAEIDLTALGAEIAATAEKVKADDPLALRKMIFDLKKQLAAKPAPPAIAPAPEPQFIDRPILTDDDRTMLAQQANLLLQSTLDLLLQLRNGVEQTADKLVALAKVDLTPQPPPTRQLATRESAPRTSPPVPVASEARVSRVDGAEDIKLGKADRAILTALALHGEMPHKRLALLAGYTPSSSGFKNPLAKLRRLELAVGGGTAISITTAGIEALGEFEPLPEGAALIEYWMSNLGRAERAILQALLDAVPAPLTHNELAERAGYEPTSSGFKNPLAKLRRLELAHGDGKAINIAKELAEANR